MKQTRGEQIKRKHISCSLSIYLSILLSLLIFCRSRKHYYSWHLSATNFYSNFNTTNIWRIFEMNDIGFGWRIDWITYSMGRIFPKVWFHLVLRWVFYSSSFAFFVCGFRLSFRIQPRNIFIMRSPWMNRTSFYEKIYTFVLKGNMKKEKMKKIEREKSEISKILNACIVGGMKPYIRTRCNATVAEHSEC